MLPPCLLHSLFSPPERFCINALDARKAPDALETPDALEALDALEAPDALGNFMP